MAADRDSVVTGDRTPAPTGSAATPAPHSQTLDRGLRVLEMLAASDRSLPISALASELGVHRSVAYRILRTLEDHRLVRRNARGHCELGLGLAVLAGSIRDPLHQVARPELASLANEVGMTAFLVVADDGEALTVVSVEPRHSQVHVAYRPGLRHPIDRGAPGLALLAGEPARGDERSEVTLARTRGWAHSHSEVLAGMSAVAAPVVRGAGACVGAVAVVYVDSGADPRQLGTRVTATARAVAAELG